MPIPCFWTWENHKNHHLNTWQLSHFDASLLIADNYKHLAWFVSIFYFAPFNLRDKQTQEERAELQCLWFCFLSTVFVQSLQMKNIITKHTVVHIWRAFWVKILFSFVLLCGVSAVTLTSVWHPCSAELRGVCRTPQHRQELTLTQPSKSDSRIPCIIILCLFVRSHLGWAGCPQHGWWWNQHENRVFP